MLYTDHLTLKTLFNEKNIPLLVLTELILLIKTLQCILISTPDIRH